MLTYIKKKDQLEHLKMMEATSTIDTGFAEYSGESEVDRLRKILGITDNIEEENDY